MAGVERLREARGVVGRVCEEVSAETNWITKFRQETLKQVNH
jgi:hypothetical protein